MSTAPQNPNRIDQTPVRLSTNMTIERQTPKSDFGDRVKVGLDQAAGAVASGMAVAAPFVPGGAIVSAAVSSVTQMSTGAPQGQSVGAQYGYAAGITNVGGGNGGMSTTLGGTGTGVSGSPTLTSTPSGPNVIPAGGSSTEALMNRDLVQSVDENQRLLRVQMQMQHETQVFTTVSNVLKVRHDTVKNTIANVR